MMVSTFLSVCVALLAFASSIDATPLRSSADALPVKTERTLVGNGGSQDSRRITARTRTTLINLDIDELSAEQIVFFEDTWMQLFNEILVVRGDHDSDEDGPSVRSFVVDGIDRGSRPNVRRLQSSWFDMWGLVELSCHLCSPDDDDRRFLSKADDEARSEFETTLCDRLRDGPFVDMRYIEDCRVVYVAK
jgi:hypothetical protein